MSQEEETSWLAGSCPGLEFLSLQVTKYKTRNGISSRDLLRLSHPKPSVLGKRKRDAEVNDMQLVLHFAAHMDEKVSHITKHPIT